MHLVISEGEVGVGVSCTQSVCDVKCIDESMVAVFICSELYIVAKLVRTESVSISDRGGDTSVEAIRERNIRASLLTSRGVLEKCQTE